MMSDLTFIIPTIGRDTLSNAVASLVNQSDPRWETVIVGDGLTPIKFYDSRIRSVYCPHKGSAGLVRNFAIENYASTEWVAFLDDDDVLMHNYVSIWHDIVYQYDPDVILFKMNNYGTIVPQEQGDRWVSDDMIRYGNIGMSFAAKRSLFQWNKFDNEYINGSGEDHRMIKQLAKNNYKIYISEYLGYIVRPHV